MISQTLKYSKFQHFLSFKKMTADLVSNEANGRKHLKTHMRNRYFCLLILNFKIYTMQITSITSIF